jgi:Predicted sulfurtransferase
MFKVAALYKFAQVAKPEDLQKTIKAKLKGFNIYGTILISDEGLNGTISGKENDLIKALDFIKKIPGSLT